MKDQLVFDASTAGSIADSDSVGAFVTANDGTLITATGTALDVSIDNASIVVTATDLDIRDLVFATDKVDVSGSEVALDAATLAALETVTVEQGTSPWVIGDGGGSITVDAVDLDIRDLTAASDSVASWTHDGTGTAITSTGTALDVNIASGTITTSDAALANTAIAHASNPLGVADTAEDAVAAPLADRKYLWIYNTDNQKIFVGATGVTVATGFPISGGAYMELRAGAAIDIEFVGSTGKTPTIKTLELS